MTDLLASRHAPCRGRPRTWIHQEGDEQVSGLVIDFLEGV
jgi:hypothetical protein